MSSYSFSYQSRWIKKHPLEFILKFTIIALVIYLVVSYFMGDNSSERAKTAVGVPTADLVLIYAPWCGHCKKMLPDYERVIADYHGKKINGYTLNILKYNAEVDKLEAEKRDVKGFPSLFFEQNGESYPFEKRTYQEIIDELNNLLS